MVGNDSFSNLTAQFLAISVVDIHPGQFSSLTFGVSSDRTGKKPKVQQRQIFLVQAAGSGVALNLAVQISEHVLDPVTF